MITEPQYLRIAEALPLLKQANPDQVGEFQRSTFFASIPAGKNVFVEGDQTNALALLLSGVVRVYKPSTTGREITLYRFGAGESCILTANAILSRQSFPAVATVEQEAEAVMVPAEAFREWIRRHDLWREFFFNMLSNRLAEVLVIVDDVAFRRTDMRVAALLLRSGRKENPIRITHQEIAAELGSIREVVSRILGNFAAEGLVRLGRGSVEILNEELLRRRSSL